MSYKRDLAFSSWAEADEFVRGLSENKNPVIAGLDEVGKGSVFGPVVVGCVVLPPDHNIKGIKDSKKLTKKNRELLSAALLELCADKSSGGYFSLGIKSSNYIDSHGIYRAIVSAASSAAEECISSCKAVDLCVTDAGIHLDKRISVPTASVIKGDNWFECISAASIIAKVFRDNYISLYDSVWPEYALARNQGYGTKDHLQAIKTYGVTDMHRRSFGVCKLSKERRDGDKQII